MLHTEGPGFFSSKLQNTVSIFFFHKKDIEREFKASVKDRKLVNERLETVENDVNHIMGRGETSNVSGIPTLNRLLSDIDELNANKNKTSTNFDDFQTSMTEKLAEETKQVFYKNKLNQKILFKVKSDSKEIGTMLKCAFFLENSQFFPNLYETLRLGGHPETT